MRKALFILFMVFSLIISSFSVSAQKLLLTYDGAVHEYTGNIFSLKVNGETVKSDLPPIIINGRSLVPVRAIFEKLGAQVSWNATEKKVTVSYNGKDIVLKINDTYATVNGQKIKMEVPAKIINDRTVVPLRFVGENLDMEVGWYPEKGEITIDNKIVVGQINDIKYSNANNLDQIKIDLDTYQNYKIMRVSEPDRIVVDFPNTKISAASPSINIDSELVKSIRCGQFNESTARVVMDVVGKPEYQVKEDEKSVILKLLPENTGTGGQNGSGNTGANNRENILNIKHVSKTDHEEVHIKSNIVDNFDSFKLTEPTPRIVVDIPNSRIEGELQRIDVNSALISAIRSANQEGNKARVVVDLKGNSNYKVMKSGEYIVVYVSNNRIADNPEISLPSRSGTGDEKNDNILYVAYEPQEGREEVVLSVNSYDNYNIVKNKSSNTIVVDIPNAVGPLEEKTISVDSKLIKNIKYAGVNGSSAKVTVQLNGKSQYRVEEDMGKMTLIISEMTDDEEFIPATPTPALSPTVKPTLTASPAITPTPDATGTNTPDKTPKAGGSNKLSVDYIINEGYNKVFLNIENYTNYNAWRLSDPNRIVIDITGAQVDEKDQKTIEIKSGLIDSIRYAQYEQDVARVVIDLAAPLQYHIEKFDGGLIVYMLESTLKNVTYSNSMDRKHFILKGAKLTEGGENLKKLYKESYDLEGRRFTITFPSNLADIGSGIMRINDGIVDYVQVEVNEKTGQTSIEFNTLDSYNYVIITRSETKDTAITLVKRYTKKDKLVVIDAGHGGVEPGAVHGGYYEKDFNLDIAKRLNELLKSKGVKTYMIREDDSFVGLYERAYIANSLNATLFLSIHNNAYYERFKGTETLYYPPSSGSTGFNGEKFAKIIQKNLVNKLNTVDRGIVQRPKLVVLKATTMHASLAEIAFMTNSEDMAKLKTESFRQKAAEALCEGILEALKEVD
ncbi:MAG: AMIN domain-containing protein [Clostridium sp.]|nr:AMIN domain-containing protein [Clostridium sp.]